MHEPSDHEVDMKITNLGARGVFIYSPKKYHDKRGEFIELYNETVLAQLQSSRFVQQNFVKSNLNVIRGMHWQESPFEQAKLITVLNGKIQDVFMDLRAGSDTFMQVFSVRLESETHDSIFIPTGFAHGYQALEQNTLVSYSVTSQYSPKHEIRLNPLSEKFKTFWKEPFLVGEQDSISKYDTN
jgi:dTDP-4-dehydrorhamnose 3,5-epimerase